MSTTHTIPAIGDDCPECGHGTIGRVHGFIACAYGCGQRFARRSNSRAECGGPPDGEPCVTAIINNASRCIQH